MESSWVPSFSHFSSGIKNERNVAQLLLDIAHKLAFGGARRVSSISEDLHQILREVANNQIKTMDGTRQFVILVDRNSVRHNVARVLHEDRRASQSEQRQNIKHRHVHGGHVERLEHDLRHALTVGLRVHQNIREQEGMFLGRNPEQNVENVVPDVLHVGPIRGDSVHDGLLECQDTALALRLVKISRGDEVPQDRAEVGKEVRMFPVKWRPSSLPRTQCSPAVRCPYKALWTLRTSLAPGVFTQVRENRTRASAGARGVGE